jgi:hypothetical protein
MAKDCHCVAELYQLFVAHQATSSNSSSSSGISKASGTIAILSGVMVFGLPPLSSISRSLFNLSATAISRKSDAPLNTRRLCVDYPFISLFARFVSSMPVGTTCAIVPSVTACQGLVTTPRPFPRLRDYCLKRKREPPYLSRSWQRGAPAERGDLEGGDAVALAAQHLEAEAVESKALSRFGN